jgi:hypothetical protein
MDGEHILNGRQFSGEFIVLEEGGGQGKEICAKLSQVWGLNGKAEYCPNLKTGKVASDQYIINIEAEKFTARGTFAKPSLIPNGIIPVTVNGVNSNWTCGIITDGKFYQAGSYDGKMYVGIENLSENEYFLGNPVIADNNNIRIEILEYSKDLIKCTVHNPLDKNINTEIFVNDSLPLGKQSTKMSLNPGQTEILSFKRI